MDRRCVAREIGEDGGIWSCLNVSGLWVELMWLLAIMEVSAQTILLADKPRSGCRGHQFSHAPGRPLLHFFLSLSQTSVGNWVSSRHVRGPFWFSYFFGSTAPQAFSRPDRRKRKPARAGAVMCGRRPCVKC